MTPNERKLLIFIRDTIAETGVPPSYSESGAALKISSKSGIVRMVTSLREQGYLAQPKPGDRRRARNTFLTAKGEMFANGEKPQGRTEADIARDLVNRFSMYLKGRSIALKQAGDTAGSAVLVEERERFDGMAEAAYVLPLEA